MTDESVIMREDLDCTDYVNNSPRAFYDSLIKTIKSSSYTGFTIIDTLHTFDSTAKDGFGRVSFLMCEEGSVVVRDECNSACPVRIGGSLSSRGSIKARLEDLTGMTLSEVMD